MNEKVRNESQWIWVKAMAIGAIGGGLVALLLYVTTGDTAYWAWPVPIGVLAGLSYSRRKGQETNQQ